MSAWFIRLPLPARAVAGPCTSWGYVAKAIAYSLNRWTGLARFFDDGRLCMTNNAAERALRGIAVGRHNWTFVGSNAGGRRAAAMRADKTDVSFTAMIHIAAAVIASR